MPFMIRWPGKIKPGVSNALVSQIDFFASFAALLGIKLEPGQAPDSRNILSTFLGKDSKGDQFILEQTNRSANAIRRGPWKYINNENVKSWNKRKKKHKGHKGSELYNLDKDVGEHHNVIKQNPEIAKEMKKLLKESLKSKGLREE